MTRIKKIGRVKTTSHTKTTEAHLAPTIVWKDAFDFLSWADKRFLYSLPSDISHSRFKLKLLNRQMVLWPGVVNFKNWTDINFCLKYCTASYLSANWLTLRLQHCWQTSEKAALRAKQCCFEANLTLLNNLGPSCFTPHLLLTSLQTFHFPHY